MAIPLANFLRVNFPYLFIYLFENRSRWLACLVAVTWMYKQICDAFVLLLRSGLEQEDMRVLYKYLTTSLFPSFKPEVKLTLLMIFLFADERSAVSIFVALLVKNIKGQAGPCQIFLLEYLAMRGT